MDSLLPLAKKVGEKLKARKETVGVSEVVGRRTCIGRCCSPCPARRPTSWAAPWSPTRPRQTFLTATKEKRAGIRSSSEPWATLCCGAGARAVEHDVGPGRDWCLRPDQQLLRRSRRPPASPSSAPKGKVALAPCVRDRPTVSPTCVPLPPGAQAARRAVGVCHGSSGVMRVEPSASNGAGIDEGGSRRGLQTPWSDRSETGMELQHNYMPWRNSSS